MEERSGAPDVAFGGAGEVADVAARVIVHAPLLPWAVGAHHGRVASPSSEGGLRGFTAADSRMVGCPHIGSFGPHV